MRGQIVIRNVMIKATQLIEEIFNVAQRQGVVTINDYHTVNDKLLRLSTVFVILRTKEFEAQRIGSLPVLIMEDCSQVKEL